MGIHRHLFLLFRSFLHFVFFRSSLRPKLERHHYVIGVCWRICGESITALIKYYRTSSPPDDPQQDVQANVAFVLGIIGLVVWIIPIIGLPVSAIGILLGRNGLHSTRQRQAVIGLILCTVGCIAGLINCIAKVMVIEHAYISG